MRIILFSNGRFWNTLCHCGVAYERRRNDYYLRVEAGDQGSRKKRRWDSSAFCLTHLGILGTLSGVLLNCFYSNFSGSQLVISADGVCF